MWVIVSSWRLRGYCRRKWPSWIQVALSIPLRSPARLATPLSLAPCSLFLFPRCPPRPSPPFCSVCSLESVISPCFSLFHPCPTSHVALFSFPPFLHADPSSPPRENGRQTCYFIYFFSFPLRSSRIEFLHPLPLLLFRLFD